MICFFIPYFHFQFLFILLDTATNYYNLIKLIFQSSAIKNSCYEGGWLDSDIITRRFLCIISERSNKFLFLTAGKFSILSLQSFTSVSLISNKFTLIYIFVIFQVIKTSYSYFALLQTLYSKNKSWGGKSKYADSLDLKIHLYLYLEI